MKAAVLIFLASALHAGCKCDCELKNAARDFIAFAEGDERVTDPVANRAKKRGYRIRQWKEERVKGRTRALADIEVAIDVDAKKLEQILRDAVHDDAILRAASAVMVRAWPEKLRSLGWPMGIGFFARDGRGWEGSDVGFEKLHVLLPSAALAAKAGLRPLTEREYLILLGIQNELERGTKLEPALGLTAKRHGIDLDDAKAIYRLSRKLAAYFRSRAAAVISGSSTDR